jgi:AcrR family transcriptional regulator
MPAKKKSIKRKQSRTRQSAAPRQRKRLSPSVRRTHIMDAAAKLIVKQGFLPLPLERLAQDAGTSKALIYTYFPTQYDLCNALLQRELSGLTTAGLDTASRIADLRQAVLLCSMLYFEHAAQTGPLLRILTADLYMAGHIAPAAIEMGNAIVQRITQLACGQLPLCSEEVAAAVEMMAVIPEEAGSLAFYKELEVGTAREICHSLVLNSLDALKSAGADDKA